jgi:hypothetical protein
VALAYTFDPVCLLQAAGVARIERSTRRSPLDAEARFRFAKSESEEKPRPATYGEFVKIDGMIVNPAGATANVSSWLTSVSRARVQGRSSEIQSEGDRCARHHPQGARVTHGAGTRLTRTPKQDERRPHRRDQQLLRIVVTIEYLYFTQYVLQ